MMSKKFNGERLKSIRIYRQMSLAQLSKETNIDINEISNFEEGISVPSKEQLFNLSNKLNIDRDYYDFLDDGIKILDIGIENKSLINTIKYQSYFEKVKATYVIYNYLQNYLMYPEDNIVNIDNNLNIEELVNKIREHYSLNKKPIINMMSFLETIGVIISPINDGKEKVNTLSLKIENNNRIKNLILLGNDKKSLCQRNYDLACRFGYIILGDSINTNIFAMEFLMPKSEFIESFTEINEIEDFINLKIKWVVPTNILIERSYSLGLISHKKYNYLLNQYQVKNLDKKDLLDDMIKTSSPSLLKRGVSVLLENKIKTETSIISDLNSIGLKIPIEEIEYLIGLKKGKLSKKVSKQKSNVLQFK